MRKMKKRHVALLCLVWLPVILTVTVLVFLLGLSFMAPAEGAALWEAGVSDFHILPEDFSIRNWKAVLYDTPAYLLHFWNSVWLSFPVVAGSVFISALTGYGLSQIPFKGKRLCLLTMIVMMLLPFQVTLTPSFILFDWLGLLGNRLAVILPNIFHPLGMVAMTYFMGAVPAETLEAARIDGAGELRLFFRVALPQAKGGIALLALYSFLDVWNLVEPVLVLIADTVKYPMSIALRSFSQANPGVLAACAVLLVLPALLIFAMTRQALTEGMRISSKE